MEQSIRCARCGELRKESEFYYSKGKRNSWCKPCFRAWAQETRETRHAFSLAQDERERGPWITVHCGWCKAPIQQRERANRKRKFCSSHCKDRQRKVLQSIAIRLAKPDRWCAWCGAKLAGWKRAEAYYCTDQCLNDAHVATGNFRRRRKDTRMRIEPRFSMHDLGERDGWVCGICDEPLDRALKWPDAHSISIDHIIPISKGGPHLAPSNLRLTHLTCNVRRQAA